MTIICSLGHEVELALLTEEVFMKSCLDIGQTLDERKVAEVLSQYKYYNKLQEETLYMYSENYVKKQGWKVDD